MPAQSDAIKALKLIEQSGFKMGEAVETAHAIAQGYEGDKLFDAIHALIHRIEGDLANAGYWDGRAGTHFGEGGFAKELDQLKALAEKANGA